MKYHTNPTAARQTSLFRQMVHHTGSFLMHSGALCLVCRKS